MKLLTRRDVAREFPRIVENRKESGRRKWIGIEYPVASKLVKALVDFRLVIEIKRKEGSREGRRLDGPMPEKQEKKVIVARRKRTT